MANTPTELSGGVRHKFVSDTLGTNTPTELSGVIIVNGHDLRAVRLSSEPRNAPATPAGAFACRYAAPAVWGGTIRDVQGLGRVTVIGLLALSGCVSEAAPDEAAGGSISGSVASWAPSPDDRTALASTLRERLEGFIAEQDMP